MFMQERAVFWVAANAGFPSEEDCQDWHKASAAQNPAVDEELAEWLHHSNTILGITFKQPPVRQEGW